MRSRRKMRRIIQRKEDVKRWRKEEDAEEDEEKNMKD